MHFTVKTLKVYDMQYRLQALMKRDNKKENDETINVK